MEQQRDAKGRWVGKTRAPVESSKAFVFLELDRETGTLTIDGTFSTPLETWAMLERAACAADEALS